MQEFVILQDIAAAWAGALIQKLENWTIQPH